MTDTPNAPSEPDVVDELIKLGRKLSDAVEYDVNGMNGKGGNGGLVSNETIKANGNFVRLLNKIGAPQ
jgi:hypothetical protein